MDEIIDMIIKGYIDVDKIEYTSYTEFEKKHNISDSIESISDDAVKEYIAIMEKDLKLDILSINSVIVDIISDLVFFNVCIKHNYYVELLDQLIRKNLYPKYHCTIIDVTFGVTFDSEDDKIEYYRRLYDNILDHYSLKKYISVLSKMKLNTYGMIKFTYDDKDINDYIDSLYNLEMIFDIFEDLTGKIYHGYIHNLGFDTYDNE